VYALPHHDLPLVNLTVWFRGGSYLVPVGKEGLAEIADEVWRTGGAGELTAQQLDEELDFLAASVYTSIGATTGSVGLNVMSKDLDPAMDLFMAVLTAPRFQQDRFDKAVDDLVQDMKTRNDDMGRIMSREWNRLMFGDGSWRTRLSTEASARALTPDDARAFVAGLIGAGNLVVSISGDIDRADAEALLERTIGGLPKLEQTIPPAPESDYAPEPGVYMIQKDDVNQGSVRFGHLGFSLGHPDQFPLTVGSDVLGGGGFTARFMKKIRSDEGLSYGAYISMPFPTDTRGTFYGGFQSKSSTCAYATQLGMQLTQSLRSDPPSDAKYSGPPTDEEMRTAKNSFIEVFPRNFESKAATVGLFAQDELLGRPHSYWYEWRDKVRAVTSKQVQAAYARNVDPAKMVVLVVGDLDEIMQGHPDHDASFTDFGEIRRIALRDPLTLEPLAE
jgi:predicted Zn-dependent peptidase